MTEAQTVLKEKEWNLIKNLYNYLDINVWCEQCSTEDHPIQMSCIEGIYFRCPLCKKEVMVMAEIKHNIGTHYAPTCKRCQDLKRKGIEFGVEK